ncbi:MAG: CHAT domain-containing protein, partial [Phycisphaerales bacterium]
TWPVDGPRPRPQLLGGVADVRNCFAAGRDGFYLIAGVNQQTITNLTKRGGEFIYHKSVEGDGTVPLDFAELPDTKTYYVEEEHGSLPNNRQVAYAVKDILAEGRTARLWDRWVPARRGEVRLLPERELRVPAFEGRTGKDVLQREIRGIVAEFASPEARDGAPSGAEAPVAAGAAGAGGAAPMEGVVVGRRRQHRIEIRLFRGSISDADARAYVLGVFRGVAPMGAARALDERLEGAITDFTRHRMFAGNVGEVFMMPTGRHVVRAENVVFVGLGPSDHFGYEAQELVSENVVRTLVRTKVEDFATVLVGAGTGLSTTKSLYHLLSGLFRGLRDVDDRNHFRSVTLCEIDKDRYEQIKEELYRLAGTSLFDDFEVTFDELEPLPPVAVAVPPRRPLPGPEPVYLTVRQEFRNNVHEGFRVSLLRAAKKATVLTDIKEFPSSELNAHLDKIELASFTMSRLPDYGDRLAELTLPEQIAGVLARDFERHLVVVHDSGAARVPWELIRIDGRFPASEGGLSRQYMAEDLSVAKWLEQRQYGPTLDILLVVNPTEDLDGAEEEGRRVQQLLADNPAIRVEVLRGPQATRSALRTRFQSGEYDVVHYAGHAFFDPVHRARSGILCHGRQVLSGADLASIGNLPALVFFNACEAGRIRRGAARRKKELAVEKRIERNIGLAEAFLRGGVANYVGTYWPVGDTPAKRFAETFYKKLLTGGTLAEALLAGRRVVKDIPSVDWADYIHYGCYDFRLKVV